MERIKNVLNYRKPTLWIILISIVLVFIISVFFIKNAEGNSHGSHAANETSSETDNQILSEGKFDNVMGYSGYYTFYSTFPINGYYYMQDGSLLAQVWVKEPDDVTIIDLDADGNNELIANLLWADGATDVIIYKDFSGEIRYAYLTDLLDEPYDNLGIGAIGAQYIKENNQVKIQYWVNSEQKFNEKYYDINLDLLNWEKPIWDEN